MASTESPQIENEEATDIKPQKGWLVVLHNDDYHTFPYVIFVLCQILDYSVPEAEEKALEIHNNGKAVVAGPMSKYEAEMIARKITSFGPDVFSPDPSRATGLATTVEPA